MEFKPGIQLASTCCETRVVVVRPPTGDVELTCGGHPMVAAADVGEPTDTPLDGHDGGSQMGKRYQAPGVSMELLCTKDGAGALAVNGELLDIKETKAVPSSD